MHYHRRPLQTTTFRNSHLLPSGCFFGCIDVHLHRYNHNSCLDADEAHRGSSWWPDHPEAAASARTWQWEHVWQQLLLCRLGSVTGRDAFSILSRSLKSSCCIVRLPLGSRSLRWDGDKRLLLGIRWGKQGPALQPSGLRQPGDRVQAI